MKNYSYNNGLIIPQIGFGTADLVGDDAEMSELIYQAIKAGHRLIDTAQVYGSEHAVGTAVKRSIDEGIVSRDELFIQTKYVQTNDSYHDALARYEKSINTMQLEYLDMYLIHWPVPRGLESCYREQNLATWKAFEELKREGRVRYIGVCNFLERHLLHIMDACSDMPVVNQLELHPGFQQKGLVMFCRERGIEIEAWSPMGRGILRHEDYIKIAQKYGKDIGQLALRWSLENHFTPLTRSSDPKHIKNNLNVFDFQIDSNDMEALDQLNSNENHLDIWSYRRQMMY